MNIPALLVIGVALTLTGCEPPQPDNKSQQSQRAADAMKTIAFDDNAEIDNIKNRLKLTADPGKVGFILLLNQAGQPILYEAVKGKVTSGGKRLTPPDRQPCYSDHPCVRAAASDEGTWGSSSPYIFYWNADGVYRQWDGVYLYSDQPIRLRVEPLVVSLQAAAK